MLHHVVQMVFVQVRGQLCKVQVRVVQFFAQRAGWSARITHVGQGYLCRMGNSLLNKIIFKDSWWFENNVSSWNKKVKSTFSGRQAKYCPDSEGEHHKRHMLSTHSVRPSFRLTQSRSIQLFWQGSLSEIHAQQHHHLQDCQSPGVTQATHHIMQVIINGHSCLNKLYFGFRDYFRNFHRKENIFIAKFTCSKLLSPCAPIFCIVSWWACDCNVMIEFSANFVFWLNFFRVPFGGVDWIKLDHHPSPTCHMISFQRQRSPWDGH